ncbi:MAG: DUF362 domain-containing protein [Syntrophales bacterium]|nr:DUF362 domain-containing protein [Syntrophales bacterium]
MLNIIKYQGREQVKKELWSGLDEYAEVFPLHKDARILLKPNLNSNMNALTGNTVDLRILAWMIEYFKARGYSHILIGDGTNSLFYRQQVNVISRLRVNELARYYQVETIDLNYAQPREIAFENGVKAFVAKICSEVDLFINLPKLKTHFEMGMSVCLKNLMGCLVGQENKKKTHQSLARNIIHINEHLKPHLHIVDGLIAMEGLGPTRGTPVNLGLIIVGVDPFLIDLVCARLAMFDYRKVHTLALAERLGLLTEKHFHYVETLNLKPYQRKFLPPVAGFLARFIHHPKRQKYFLKIRNTKFFNHLCSTKAFGKFLFLTGLRQDMYMEEEMRCDALSVDMEKCDQCGKCREYCPLGADLPEAFMKNERECISCLYCYFICPEKAITFEGELGFAAEQLKQYDDIVRMIG